MRVDINKILKMKMQGFIVNYTDGIEEKSFKIMTIGKKRAKSEAKWLVDWISKKDGKKYKVSCVAAEE